MEREHSSAGRTVLIGLGVLLVLFGIWALIGQTGLIPRWLIENWGKLRDGIVLVLLGAFVIWLATGGSLKSPPSGTRLYRSREDKWLAGVFGGLGDYLKIDPLILRISFIVLVALGFGWVVAAYILMAIFVPVEPMHAPHTGPDPWVAAGQVPPAPPVVPPAPPVPDAAGAQVEPSPIPPAPGAPMPVPPEAPAPQEPPAAGNEPGEPS